MRRAIPAVLLAIVVVGGCTGPADSTSTTPAARNSTIAVNAGHTGPGHGRTVPDVPSVTDPDFYQRTCTDLRATQNETGLHPGVPDDQTRAFLIAQEHTSWWPTATPDHLDTYERAVRDFTAGKC